MAELTETSPETPETTEAIRAVEAFLNALQNEDFDTVDAALGDDLVYENVGFSRIRGGRRTATLLRRMQGRVGFEVKIHRIGADGAAVLTERTDALIIGPLRVAVLGLRRIRGGRWADHPVAGLLRCLRHVQGPLARPGGAGGAIAEGNAVGRPSGSSPTRCRTSGSATASRLPGLIATLRGGPAKMRSVGETANASPRPLYDPHAQS